MNNEEEETTKIIAHIWERYENMSEEEKKKWSEEIDRRLIEDELEEEQERLNREEASKNGSDL